MLPAAGVRAWFESALKDDAVALSAYHVRQARAPLRRSLSHGGRASASRGRDRSASPRSASPKSARQQSMAAPRTPSQLLRSPRTPRTPVTATRRTASPNGAAGRPPSPMGRMGRVRDPACGCGSSDRSSGHAHGSMRSIGCGLPPHSPTVGSRGEALVGGGEDALLEQAMHRITSLEKQTAQLQQALRSTQGDGKHAPAPIADADSANAAGQLHDAMPSPAPSSSTEALAATCG